MGCFVFFFFFKNSSVHCGLYSLRSVRAVALAKLFRNMSFEVYKHTFFGIEKNEANQLLKDFFFSKPCDQYLLFLKD